VIDTNTATGHDSTRVSRLIRCVFLPDNGAFFVNYIITSAFIGAAIELLRLADLVFYVYVIGTARSTAERHVIRHVSRRRRSTDNVSDVVTFVLVASVSFPFRRAIRVDIGRVLCRRGLCHRLSTHRSNR
jgi:hypothetical protein